MLRKIIYATLIVILTIADASAQTDQPVQPGLPGYTNVLRSPLERKTDKEIDSAYKSTIKVVPNAKKETSDPWGDVRPEPAAAKNKRQ